jgi:hypothetical protein
MLCGTLAQVKEIMDETTGPGNNAEENEGILAS